MHFTNQLQSALEAHKNEAFAQQMQAYMKDLFTFLGVKAPLRKATLNELVKKEKVELLQNSRSIAKNSTRSKSANFSIAPWRLPVSF